MVVTILGILAAIVTLSLVGLTTNAVVQSCNQEYKTVQAALDAYMADKNLDTIPGGTDTNNMVTPVALYNTNPGPANAELHAQRLDPVLLHLGHARKDLPNIQR